MTEPRAEQLNVFLPKAMTPAALDAVIRLNVESTLARTGQRPITIERGVGYEHSPGVWCWPVTYTTDSN
ncbi:hypothetical protein DFR70_11179 [Nocardia tenerifensis]|uniref:Uncharacterized protein n=1 Tax=Nocardia tenerifensis TaxID=228006 RepID=A0A318JYA1_9NOCA|nr:hypothetical protein [Nocardia tenerifensis]PXX59697.1 hypothetical protein DFR70_11179 [Nocardia tenerifensis]